MTTVNIIKFEKDDIENSRGQGTIATLTFDAEIILEPNTSDNAQAPTHRVLAKSPQGRLFECGGVWKKHHQVTGDEYFTINIREFNFNANLGQAAGQDDVSVQVVIAWAPQSQQAYAA